VLRVVPRHVIRERLLLHRCTYVLVLNPGGELYVHRRTASKGAYPSFYDVCAGGVCAVGESFDDRADRRVEERIARDAFCPDGIEVHRRWIEDRRSRARD
jgi:isopentenyldiphosphate isomerase